MINELSKEIYENAKTKGFYDDAPRFGERIALIHSEVSEALECDRINKRCEMTEHGLKGLMLLDDETFKTTFKEFVKDSVQDELSDIMIRVMDLAAHEEIDLETHIKAKMRYNSLRPYKHGKAY